MLWEDVRFALRLMRRSPGFTGVAVLSLALGIGANTAIFSLLNTVMLRTLPVEHPEQLVELLQRYPGEPRGNGYWSWASYQHFRDNNHVFSALTGTQFDNVSRVRIEGGDSDAVIAEYVLGNYFSVLGLKPAIGRLIGQDDVPASGTGNAVVLSWSYWGSRFNRDPGVLGKRIFVADVPMTVVGVAPPAYAGPRVGARTAIWVPREKQRMAMVGRLKGDATIEQARAEMPVLYQFTIAEARAERSKDPLVRQLTMEVESAGAGLTQVRDWYGKPLVVVMALVGLLLLLACINLAGMLLARGAARRREMAVRVGLGASRWRLVKQMLTESVLLSGAGTIVGAAFAYLGTEVLVRIMASGREHERISLQVEPDLHVLLFTCGIAVFAGLLFGLAPAWYAGQRAPVSGLRQSGRGGDTRRWRIFGKSLVAAQVALSILLAAAAGVFLSHLSKLRNQDLGFRKENVLLVVLEPERSGYQRAQLAQPYRDLLARLETIPGVRSVSISGCTPIQGCGASRFVRVEAFVERPEDRRYAGVNWVAPRYFETLRTPFVAGRDFTFEDANRGPVAIITESMARHYFHGVSPLGKRVTVEWGRPGDETQCEVVGLVGDAKYTELRQDPPRAMYFNMFQKGRLFHQFILRTDVEPKSVTAQVRRAMADVLKTVPVTKVVTLSDQVDAAIVPERLIATLSGYFGVLGALLAGIGLYGLLAFTVARRVNEIGVRMALGATPSDVRRLVVRDALGMVCAGLACGAGMVLWAGPLAGKLLEDLKPDRAGPLVLGAAAIVVVAVVASYIPARRAARVDPLVALRSE